MDTRHIQQDASNIFAFVTSKRHNVTSLKRHFLKSIWNDFFYYLEGVKLVFDKFTWLESKIEIR